MKPVYAPLYDEFPHRLVHGEYLAPLDCWSDEDVERAMQSLRAWPGMKSESDTAILFMLNRFVSSSKRNYVQRRRDALKKNSDFTEELMAQEHERNSDEENKMKEALSRAGLENQEEPNVNEPNKEEENKMKEALFRDDDGIEKDAQEATVSAGAPEPSNVVRELEPTGTNDNLTDDSDDDQTSPARVNRKDLKSVLVCMRTMRTITETYLQQAEADVDTVMANLELAQGRASTIRALRDEQNKIMEMIMEALRA